MKFLVNSVRHQKTGPRPSRSVILFTFKTTVNFVHLSKRFTYGKCP